MKLKKLIYSALLTATALIMFLIELQIPPLSPIPGIKPGLSNIITLFCLYTLGGKWALQVLLCRICLGCFLTGQASAILYSLAGGLPALGLSCLLKRHFHGNQLWVASVFSAITHNVCQLLCAIFLTATPSLLFYLPVLLIAGIIAGAFTGVAAQGVLQRLNYQT